MQSRRIVIVLIVTALVTLAAAWLAEQSFTPDGATTIDANANAVDLRSDFLFVPDVGQTPETVLEIYKKGDLLPTLDSALDQTVPYQAVWAVVRVKDTGESARYWRIVSQIYGVVGLKAYVADDAGAVDMVLDYSARAPARSGQYTGPLLRSQVFALPAGQDRFVIAAIKRGPVASAALQLETDDRVVAHALRDTLTLSLFYGVSVAALAFFLAFGLAMQSAGAVGYAALSFLGLGFVAYLDGLTFRFLYPSLPQVHLHFGLVLLLLISGVGFQVAAVSLQERGERHHLARRVLSAAALLCAACIVLVFVVPPEVMALVSYCLVALMFLGQFVSSVTWGGLSPSLASVVHALTTFCAAAAVAIVLLLFTGRMDGALDPGTMVRAFYAVIAIWIIAGVTIGLVDLRRQHADAQAGEMIALKRAAETAADLLKAEQSYSRARDLARTRSRQLASASHDLKQPIASLRLTMDRVAKDQPADVRERLTEAFDYMLSLSQGYLDQTTSDDIADAAPPSETAQSEETFSVELGCVANVVEIPVRHLRAGLV